MLGDSPAHKRPLNTGAAGFLTSIRNVVLVVYALAAKNSPPPGGMIISM